MPENESQAQYRRLREAYKKAYPDATDADVLEAYKYHQEVKFGVRSPLGFRETTPDPETLSGKVQLFPENVSEAITRATGSPTAGTVGGAATSLLVPQSPGEILATIGGPAGNLLGRGVSQALGRAPRALPLLGRVSGTLAGGAVGEGSLAGGLPYAAGETAMEAGRGALLAGRSVMRAAGPFPANERFTQHAASAIERELSSPGLISRISQAREPIGERVVMTRTRMLDALGEAIGDAESQIRSAIGGGNTTLVMPSLTSIATATIPGHPVLTRRVAKPPTFDEALKIVKKTKSDARIAEQKALNQEELLQAQAMKEKADRLEQEFHSALDMRIGPTGPGRQALTAAQTRFGRGLRIRDFLEQDVWYQGPSGATLDPMKAQTALLKDLRALNPDEFPELTRAISRGSPLGRDISMGVPLSVQPGSAGPVRGYMGGLPLFNVQAGRGQGPAMLTSGLMSLLGGTTSRPWHGPLQVPEEPDFKRLPSSVGP